MGGKSRAKRRNKGIAAPVPVAPPPPSLAPVLGGENDDGDGDGDGDGNDESAKSPGNFADDIEDTIDAQAFEVLSRSVPTNAAVLEPESIESAFTRRTSIVEDAAARAYSPAAVDPELAASRRAGDAGVDDNEPDHTATETSPLIRDRHRRSSTASSSSSSSSSSSLAKSSVASAPLYLNGVSPGRFWAIFAQLMLANFIACFDGTILASSHPVITSHFGAANAASWLSTAFLLTSTAAQPLLGRLSDAVGRKPLFVGCGVVFVLATVWCALARSIGEFIAARALCGLGAGGSAVMGSIITSDLVPIERRGSYQAYINLVYGCGSALGAALGGVMAEQLGWRWEFGIQVPPLVLCFAISVAVIPADLGIQDGRKSVWQSLREFDSKGSILLTLAVTFFILGLNLGGNILPWSHPFVIISLVIFAICSPLFVWVESRVPKPIMPLHLVRKAPRANLIFSNFIAMILLNAIIFNIPIYYQAVLLMSATKSGLSLVLPSVVSSMVGASTGFAINWTRRLKWPVVSGAVFYFIACIQLCLLPRGLPSIIYLLILVLPSFGQGLIFPGTFMAILGVSEQSEQAVITSTLILWRSVGSVLGVASSSLVLQNALVSYLDKYVTGDNKAEIVDQARSSIEAVAELDMPWREQVIQSYEAALRLTFIVCAVMGLISVLIVIPMRLPRLRARK